MGDGWRPVPIYCYDARTTMSVPEFVVYDMSLVPIVALAIRSDLAENLYVSFTRLHEFEPGDPYRPPRRR